MTAQRACVSDTDAAEVTQRAREVAQRAEAEARRVDVVSQRGIEEGFVEQTFRISASEERYYYQIEIFVG